ncbi:hypothetical protein RR48_00808 [Papilio machaon]|uniref:Uncharacterized protein n=1 Tax=Papilio machaon TaxID=76193 RepID=A0A0N1ID82_PAPMA|nr:hypothetical protein RR48_00808 [Papilio machaon]
MDFGFTGIWQWRSALDFVYVYKLYTPLDGFEENGLVLKNVFGVNTGGGLDTELSMRLSKHKFGIAILLVDKGKGLLDVVKDRFQHKPSDPDMFVENFDTTANVVLDTLYYPTITFHAHMMKTYTEMRNTLNLVTPFQAIKELKSVYTVDITIGEKFNVTCVALLYNGTYWHEISYKILYEYECGEDDAYQSYLASVGIATPLAVLPGLEARVSARLEDALWKMAADISMPSFTVNALARLELDDPFIETSGSLNLTSTYLEDYFIKMEFKKDFSDVESVDMPQVQGKEMFLKSRVDAYPGLRRVLSVQAATPLRKLSFLKGDTDFEFGPKTGYLLCKYELPDMKGDGDLKWSFLIGDLYITVRI